MPDDLLQQLQKDIFGRLENDDAFFYVASFLNRPRDAAAAVMIREGLNKALLGVKKQNGKGGLSLMVMMPDAEVVADNVPGPQFDLIGTVRVFENPVFNEGASGTGISAEQCALNVLGLLHHWNPGSGQIYADKKALRESLAPEGCIAYDVVVRQRGGLMPRTPVQVPRITFAGMGMTIACATPEAAIYWTHDGSLPTPTNGTLYSGEVDVGELGGQAIRAVAYKDGFAASDGALKAA